MVWVTRAQQGDLVAFERLVRSFQDMAVAYAGAILGDFDLAQDAAQEAFIQACGHLSDLEAAEAFPAWLRRILVGQCDRLMRKRRLHTVPLHDGAELADPDCGPLDALQRQELHDTVLAALRALPEREREVTALYYIDGYSLAEVGEFLEVPVSTVKNRLHTARRRLREQVGVLVQETLRSQAPGEGFFLRIIERGPYHVVGVYCTFEGDDEDPAWSAAIAEFHKRRHEITNRKGDMLLGFLYRPHKDEEAIPESIRSCFVGVEVEDLDHIPDGMAATRFSGGQYAVVELRGDVQADVDEGISEAIDLLHKQWLRKHGYREGDACFACRHESVAQPPFVAYVYMKLEGRP